MRFELTVALKYLIPRWRQLSVSIISLISILVISLVVWLVVLFLSVTDGMEKKWVEQLVALNAPVRVAPTDAYYRSYYYQIDTASLASNYTAKTIGEKLKATQSDPYDPTIDVELGFDFPPPDRRDSHSIKDPVKEAWESILTLKGRGIRPQEYEVSFGNMHLEISKKNTSTNESGQTFLSQVSYIASHDPYNMRLKDMIVPPSTEDYANFLQTFSHTSNQNPTDLRKNLERFFDQVTINGLQTTEDGFVLPPAFFPEKGELKGVGIVRYHAIQKVVIPRDIDDLPALESRLKAFGFEITPVDIIFNEEQMHISSNMMSTPGLQLILNDHIPFKAKLIPQSLKNATTLSSVLFELQGEVQGISLFGKTHYQHLALTEATPSLGKSASLWFETNTEGTSKIPFDQTFGDGVLIAKHFQNSGVHLGDRGYLSYYTPTASSMQEQRIPIYVAGFYDPGMMPIGNKLMFVDPSVVALLRGNVSVSDTMLGNGINIWLDNISEAEAIKTQLIQMLDSKDIGQYWEVTSFHDYDFARPILQQLKSDKNLFTLIAIIILVVACSNIISMLILLVNDKKREIGILQSMGASPKRIATIFGMCGFVMGIISCILGTLAAIFTLSHLESLVNFLSFLQGHEAFQAAFYGSSLPNELSFTSLVFVVIATMAISLLAGIVPAIKAARIRPTEILKAE